MIAGRHEQTPPPTYRTSCWPACNEALKRRGSLTIWFDPAMTWAAAPTGKRGRQPVYSDAAVQTCLTMKVLFGMALRQTTGFVESLLGLIGLDWAVPDFSTISRRQKRLKVNISYRGAQGPLHLRIDSTGIKVEGEGEWNARKHGGTKRRVWRKIHLGIDEETLEIRAAEVTTRDVGDAPMLPELLDQIPPDQEIASVTADGAFDTRKCHDAIAARGAAAIIPPRRNAKPWKADTARGSRAQRGPARITALRPHYLATMERVSPPEPRRDVRRIRKQSGGLFSRRSDALRQTAGPAPHGAGLRPSGRGVPGQGGRPERFHRARHTPH